MDKVVTQALKGHLKKCCQKVKICCTRLVAGKGLKPFSYYACIMTIGIIFLAGGVLLFVNYRVLKRQGVLANAPIKQGSFTEEKWLKNEYRILLEVYMFNVTNTENILQYGAKPILDRKGPYAFLVDLRREILNRHHKDDFRWNEYQNIKTYTFSTRFSCLTCFESDAFTVPSVATVVAVNMLNLMGFAGRNSLKFYLIGKDIPIFITKKIPNLLFEGYEDPVLNAMRNVPNFLVPDVFLPLPEKLGFFLNKNATLSIQIEMDTGEKEPIDVGKILTYRYKPFLYFWNTKEANVIEGTDGTNMFRPFLDESQQPDLKLFFEPLCRSFTLNFKSHAQYEGMNAYRYLVRESDFNWSAAENLGFMEPTEEIFYPNLQKKIPFFNAFALPSGLLNATKCYKNLPYILSNENFLYAPRDVFEAVKGLREPEAINHSTQFLIEPITGIILEYQYRYQLNLPIYGYEDYIPVSKAYIIPVFIVKETGNVDDGTQDRILFRLYILPKIIQNVSFSLVFIGLLIILIIAYCLMKARAQVVRSWLSKSGLSSVMSRSAISQSFKSMKSTHTSSPLKTSAPSSKISSQLTLKKVKVKKKVPKKKFTKESVLPGTKKSVRAKKSAPSAPTESPPIQSTEKGEDTKKTEEMKN